MTTASKSLTADLLARPGADEQARYLTEQGLADDVGLGWILDRADELVDESPATTDDLARLCESMALRLDLPALAGRARYLIARVCAERGDQACP